MRVRARRLEFCVCCVPLRKTTSLNLCFLNSKRHPRVSPPCPDAHIPLGLSYLIYKIKTQGNASSETCPVPAPQDSMSTQHNPRTLPPYKGVLGSNVCPSPGPSFLSLSPPCTHNPIPDPPPPHSEPGSEGDLRPSARATVGIQGPSAQHTLLLHGHTQL